MNTISDTFINAILADAAYADKLIDGLKGSGLLRALEKGMTPILAKYISDNFSVVAHRESDDGIFSGGSGFDATVWRGVEGGAFAGKIYVSMQGTLGAQDFLTDADLALPFGAGRQQIVDMVNWWKHTKNPHDHSLCGSVGDAASLKHAMVCGP